MPGNATPRVLAPINTSALPTLVIPVVLARRRFRNKPHLGFHHQHKHLNFHHALHLQRTSHSALYHSFGRFD
jgi:hypothetical protein